MSMKTLSKSKLLAYRQCPKRLWLEVHEPDLRLDSAAAEASFATGHQVGAIARTLYDPDGTGTFLDLSVLGMPALLSQTKELLEKRKPIFEAGFVAVDKEQGALALVDVLLPVGGARSRKWRMVEVKSSTSVKDYHLDDVAIQHLVASAAGVKISNVALACIDSTWTYPGDQDYSGLLVETDLTEQAIERQSEVESWIAEAHQIAARKRPPAMGLGALCSDPFECGFIDHCTAQDEARHGVVEHPVQWLPRIQAKALKAHIASEGVRSMKDVPDELLNSKQLRVKKHTLNGKVYFDAKGAAANLAAYKLPALFLDFETIAYAVPRWAGTRPYQQIPFQFSLHRLLRTGCTEHSGFLDLSGRDPSAAFVRALLDACTGTGPIFVYNKGFEGARIEELAKRFPRSASKLLAIAKRLIDLLPVTQDHYYHPEQQGSWSIKAVLPTVASELRYDDLDGVQDGGGAQAAFLKAVATETPIDLAQALRQQLWRYCRLDTFAMVRLWAHLAGRTQFINPSDNAPSPDAPN